MKVARCSAGKRQALTLRQARVTNKHLGVINYHLGSISRHLEDISFSLKILARSVVPGNIRLPSERVG